MFEQISRWKKGVTMKRFKLLVIFHPLRLFLDVEQRKLTCFLVHYCKEKITRTTRFGNVIFSCGGYKHHLLIWTDRKSVV